VIRLAFALTALTACFEPAIREGYECSEGGTCPPGQLCLPAASGASPSCQIPDPCDLLAQDCPARAGFMQNCYLYEGAGACAPSGQDRRVGEACSAAILNECVSGAGCFDDVCRQFCDFAGFPDQPTPCDAGLLCRALTNDVGACR
jgi:hypothetical protein